MVLQINCANGKAPSQANLRRKKNTNEKSRTSNRSIIRNKFERYISSSLFKNIKNPIPEALSTYFTVDNVKIFTHSETTDMVNVGYCKSYKTSSFDLTFNDDTVNIINAPKSNFNKTIAEESAAATFDYTVGAQIVYERLKSDVGTPIFVVDKNCNAIITSDNNILYMNGDIEKIHVESTKNNVQHILTFHLSV